MIRTSFVFSGRVQGVGFRYTAFEKAKSFEIVGWVRNLPNGTVNMIVEGERPEVNSFLNALELAIANSGYGRIDHVERIEEPATGEFSVFSIRR